MEKRSMVLYWFSIALAVTANVFYHIVQKKTPAAANPALTLAVTYMLAGFLCFVAFLVLPGRDSMLQEIRRVNWTSLALGVTIIGLELGFLLAYRAGGNMNVSALIVNTAVSALLVPVGLLLFGEAIKPVNIAGLLLCVAGLFLVAQK